MRTLLEVTVGVAERLRDELSHVSDLHAAAIHGSWVAGAVRPDSDIDLMVVSDGDRRGVQRIGRRVGKAIGREVDVTVLSLEELRSMYRTRNPFLRRIVRGTRIDLIGDLGRLAPTA